MKNRKILACRLCLCREMNNIIDFGHVPLGNNLQKNVHLANSVKTYPLAVQKCKKWDKTTENTTNYHPKQRSSSSAVFFI